MYIKDDYQKYWNDLTQNSTTMTLEDALNIHGYRYRDHWNDLYSPSGVNYDIVTQFIQQNR